MAPFHPTSRWLARANRTFGASRCRRLALLLSVLAPSVLLPLLASADAAPAYTAELPTIGTGVDSTSGGMRGQCVQGTSELRLDPRARMSASFASSFRELTSSSTGAVSGRIDLGLVGGSVRADYLARLARTELSAAYTLDLEAKIGDVLLRGVRLSPDGESAARSTDAERLEACGDTFVSSSAVGLRLLLGANLHFSSRSELERFTGRVRVEALLGFAHSTRNFAEETRSFEQSAYLEVSALQEGGDPAALEALLGDRSALVCRLDAVEPCLQLFQELLSYAAHVPAQFGESYRVEQLAPLSVRTTAYADSDVAEVMAHRQAPRTLALATLRRLVERRAVLLAREARLRLLIEVIADPARRERLLAAQGALEQRRSALESVIAACRAPGSGDACAAADAALAGPDEAFETLDLTF